MNFLVRIYFKNTIKILKNYAVCKKQVRNINFESVKEILKTQSRKSGFFVS